MTLHLGMEGMDMPWKTRSHLDERMNFISRMQSGEKVTDLCKEFEISRKTAYKLWSATQSTGPQACMMYRGALTTALAKHRK